MIDEATVAEIERAIEELAQDFRETPGLLLTEDDLKCQLTAKFYRIGHLGVPVASFDPDIRATAIHTEVPWFDEYGKLRLRPDITITDPKELSIQQPIQQGPRLPRKGCHFIGPSIVVELKFYRGRQGIRSSAVVAIRKDVEKIERLVARGQRLSPAIFLHGIVVVFSRYSGKCEALFHLAEESRPKVTVIVRSADVNRL